MRRLKERIDPSITELLAQARSGDNDAAEAVARAVHGELRVLAASYLSRERPDHTLQPTALVNEAYLKLLGQERVTWKNRSSLRDFRSKKLRKSSRCQRPPYHGNGPWRVFGWSMHFRRSERPVPNARLALIVIELSRVLRVFVVITFRVTLAAPHLPRR